MTQQPGGWPAAQQTPQQNQFPPSQGWPPGPGQQAPPQQPVAAPRSAEDFFDGVGGVGAPSFKFQGVGDSIVGTIVDQFATVVTDTSGNVKRYEKSGEVIPQLNITLQTELRNWDHVNKIPVDDQGNPKMPGEDDGLRRIYVKYDMRRAVGAALQAAKAPAGGLQNGGKLAVLLSGGRPTGQPNDLPLYEARYQAPAPTTAFDFGADTQGQPAQQAPQQQPAPVVQQDPWATAPQQQPTPQGFNDDPPF